MVIIEVPFSGGSLGKSNGVSKAPKAVLKALSDIFINESFSKVHAKSLPLKIDNSNIETSFLKIEKSIESLNEKPIILGGDHSITFPSFKAFSKKFSEPGLLVFDAHPDLENNFYPPTHEDYLRRLISERHVKKENVILVGIRNFHNNELNTINALNLHVFWMKHCFNLKIEELANLIMENARRFSGLYISIDIDVIDPAFAPGTGYPEPGGFSSREMIYLIQRLINLKNLEAVDIVEINPDLDINNATARLGAKIISEFNKKI